MLKRMLYRRYNIFNIIRHIIIFNNNQHNEKAQILGKFEFVTVGSMKIYLPIHLVLTLHNCRHGSDLSLLSWKDAYDKDFPLMMAIIDLLNCIPPTSVKCETTFSQMKLIKTSKRTSMKGSTLNCLLTVKLLSPSIHDFDPKSSVDRWQVRYSSEN